MSVENIQQNIKGSVSLCSTIISTFLVTTNVRSWDIQGPFSPICVSRVHKLNTFVFLHLTYNKVFVCWVYLYVLICTVFCCCTILYKLISLQFCTVFFMFWQTCMKKRPAPMRYVRIMLGQTSQMLAYTLHCWNSRIIMVYHESLATLSPRLSLSWRMKVKNL